MKPEHAIRRLARRRDRRNRERRRVRRQDRVAAHRLLERAEQRAFGGEIFDHRLDHQAALSISAELAQRLPLKRDARHHLVRRVARHASFLDFALHGFRDVRLRALGGALGRVAQNDLMPRGGRDLRDAGAHGAGADHPYTRLAIELHRQRPVKTGARFSRKARTPSA